MVQVKSRILFLMTSSVLLASGAVLADQAVDLQGEVRQSIIASSYGGVPAPAGAHHSDASGTPSDTQRSVREMLLGVQGHGFSIGTATDSNSLAGAGDFQTSVRQVLTGERR